MIDDQQDEIRVPVYEEQLHVGKRVVETDRVRVRTVVDAREMMVDGTVMAGELDVTRVTIDREVDVAPPPRQEGDMVIVSLVEERLVVEKRLFVTEEVHVRRSAAEQTVSIPVTVRAMRAEIERDGGDQVSTGRN